MPARWTYWDLVASFIVSGILHKELPERTRAAAGLGAGTRLPALDARAYKDPNYLKNLETVGTEFAAYAQGCAPAHEAFLKRIK